VAELEALVGGIVVLDDEDLQSEEEHLSEVVFVNVAVRFVMASHPLLELGFLVT